jgi:ATP-dependent DNA helicase PIF1
MNHETKITGAAELYSTRDGVYPVNERGFQKLTGKWYSFRCRDNFVWNEELHPHLKGNGEKPADGYLRSLDDPSMHRHVELKRGTPVILLANLALDCGLCSGNQGVIVE